MNGSVLSFAAESFPVETWPAQHEPAEIAQSGTPSFVRAFVAAIGDLDVVAVPSSWCSTCENPVPVNSSEDNQEQR